MTLIKQKNADKIIKKSVKISKTELAQVFQRRPEKGETCASFLNRFLNYTFYIFASITIL